MSQMTKVLIFKGPRSKATFMHAKFEKDCVNRNSIGWKWSPAGEILVVYS
jgi:hypothetical protein